MVQDAAQSANAPLVIAVADRAGKILAVFRNATAPLTSTGNFGATVDSNELAVALARTAALFSNNQAPLSSRTVRFISGIHFPPGVSDAPNADLYGIENTNRGCPLNATFLAGQSIDPARSIDGLSPGLGVITGKADADDSNPAAVNPGGVPLFKNGAAVGGSWSGEFIGGDRRVCRFLRRVASGLSADGGAASSARRGNYRRHCLALREPDDCCPAGWGRDPRRELS